MEIIETEFSKVNNMIRYLRPLVNSSKFSDLEKFSGIKFDNRFKKLINNLFSILKHSEGVDLENMKFITCKAIKPAKYSPFGMGNRSTCTIGYPIEELYDISKYKEYCESLWEDAGMPNLLYPIFDEYDDGHSLICIGKEGKVYNYIHELDESELGSLLANSQEEFINKLYLN